jgi:RNA polymerase sigma-70 factor (ECF subfamily)
VADHPEESQWVRRARTGDQAAFTALVERYWDRLRRWLYGLCGREHLAEDLTQEAFCRAWSALPRLQAEVTFKVWLFRIARNCFLDQCRGPRGAEAAPLPPNVHAREDGPLDELMEREAQQMLQKALAEMPAQYRATYLLWTQEELPYSQISEVLEITEETARWRVCKARQFLLKRLRAYLDTPKP